MSTRTRRKNRRPRYRTTTPPVDLRKPLPARTHPCGHSGIHPTELAEIRAALHAASIGIRVPVLAWHATHNGARIDYPGGNHLLHDPTQALPLTAYTPCPPGAHHAHPITGPHDLHHAEREAAACTARHAPGGFQWPDMVRTTTVHTLGEALDTDEDDEQTEPAADPGTPPGHDDTDTERTQPIDLRDLRTDHDNTPKEHPDHG